MSKLVIPKHADPRRRWAVEFIGGLLRGTFTVGASAVLTFATIAWLKLNGYLTG